MFRCFLLLFHPIGLYLVKASHRFFPHENHLKEKWIQSKGWFRIEKYVRRKVVKIYVDMIDLISDLNQPSKRVRFWRNHFVSACLTLLKVRRTECSYSMPGLKSSNSGVPEPWRSIRTEKVYIFSMRSSNRSIWQNVISYFSSKRNLDCIGVKLSLTSCSGTCDLQFLQRQDGVVKDIGQKA